MSRGSKTITGEDTLEVDELNIVGDGIGINGNFGQAGQIVKKSTIDNSIGWFDEQTFTATLPIVLTGGQISFDTGNATTNKVRINTNNDKKTLHIGTTISLQENNGLVLCDMIDTGEINLVNSGSIDIFSDTGNTRELSIDKDAILPGSSNTNYVIGSNTYPINEIVSNALHSKISSFFGDLSGNFITLTGTSLQGNTNAHISAFKSFTLQSGDGSDATKTINSNGNIITTHGGTLKTFGGNFDLQRIVGQTTTRGQILNFSLIRGNTYALPSQNTIDTIGEARIRRIYTDDFVMYAFNDAGVNSAAKIIISGTNNSINGDGSTTMSGITSISNMSSIDVSTANITDGNFTGLISTSGNITMTGTGSDGILTTANTPIFSAGLKQAVGGGNFSITANGTFFMSSGQFSGDVDMDDNKIENVVIKDPTIQGNLDMNSGTIENVGAIGITQQGNGINMNDKAITNVGGISMTTNTSELDMNNGNITECNSIT